MRGKSLIACCFAILIFFSIGIAPVGASECAMTDPPATLEHLFVNCADASGFSSYFTESMDKDEEFEIDQVEEFQISANFSYDADSGSLSHSPWKVDRRFG